MGKGEKVKAKAAKAPKAAPAEKAPEKQVEKKAKPIQRTEKTEEELVDLTSRVYKLVVERGKDGVLQSEIWKELGLTSRDGSRLAIRLEKRGMIRRVRSSTTEGGPTSSLHSGSRPTYPQWSPRRASSAPSKPNAQ